VAAANRYLKDHFVPEQPGDEATEPSPAGSMARRIKSRVARRV